MRLFLSTIATSGVGASLEVSAFLTEMERVPDLSHWRRCDAFREASNEETDIGKLRHILQASYTVAGLPYAMAVRQLAEQCGFPRESTEFFDEYIKQTLETTFPNIRESFAKSGKEILAKLIQQDGLGPREDMSVAIIREIMRQNVEEKEKIASIIKLVKERADRAIESLNLDESPLTPLTEQVSAPEVTSSTPHTHEDIVTSTSPEQRTSSEGNRGEGAIEGDVQPLIPRAPVFRLLEGTAAPTSFRANQIPPLAKWNDCQTFRLAQVKSEETAVMEYFYEFLESAGLPYTLAVLQLIRECLSDQTALRAYSEKHLDIILHRQLKIAYDKLQRTRPDDDVAELFMETVVFKGEEDESLRTIIGAIQEEAQDMEDRGESIKDFVIDRSIMAAQHLADEKLDEIPRKDWPGAPLRTFYSQEDQSTETTNSQPSSEEFSDILEIHPLTEPISSEETRDAIELQVSPFLFKQSDSNLCVQLTQDENTPATYLQSVLETYGLGYALLLGNRLDHCAQDETTSLVKQLHNDLYKWLSLHHPESSGTLNQKIFEDLKLPQPSARQERDWLAHPSTIGLADLIERVAIEQILSPVERKK